MTAARSALVVGGGVVGLVCARALALRGLNVVLLERKPRIEDEGGIGIGLQNNALNALDQIGVAQQVVDNGVAVDTLNMMVPSGAIVGSRPTERYAGSTLPGYLGVSRAKLHSLLVDAAQAAGVVLETNAELIDVESGANRVIVRLADGSEHSADMLVGCDGIYSRLRAHLFPDHAEAIPTGQAIWRALIPGEQKHDVSLMFGGQVGTIGYCPLPGELYLYIVDRSDRPPPRDINDLAESFAALLRTAKGFPEQLASRLSRRQGDINYRLLEYVDLPAPWHRDRTILIGDAAHAGPPTLAQGAAMGIEDAVVLAECVAQSADLPQAFDAFTARRTDRVRGVLGASLTLARAQMEAGSQEEMAAANRAAAMLLSQPF